MFRIFKSFPRLSPLTTEDSDGNAMLATHAYRARIDGEVSAVHDVDFGSGRGLYLYVGDTADPPTDGVLAQVSENDGNSFNNQRSVSFQIAKDEYFEVRVYSGTPTIRWRSKGVMKKPIDFD